KLAVGLADLVMEGRLRSAGVHQPHQKHPGLAACPGDVDQHLEEVDLREAADTSAARTLRAVAASTRRRPLSPACHADPMTLVDLVRYDVVNLEVHDS